MKGLVSGISGRSSIEKGVECKLRGIWVIGILRKHLRANEACDCSSNRS
jgi:hypothetical protein